VDRAGREKGRGAYVCASPECVTKALGKGRLEHAFRRSCAPSAGLAEAVLADAAQTSETESSDRG
jgi:predicted RNA-binding protein YlxR (DUF448 family)